MRLFLFSWLLPISLLAFDDNACLRESFEVNVIHKSFPFGLLQKELKVKKETCEISLSFSRYKYLHDFWTIDTCRSPVHIKKGTESVEVLRKNFSCENGNKGDDFCSEWKTLKKIIQDNGLIFAEGSKENLSEDHGKVHCAYTLLNAYLDQNFVLSKSGNYQNLQEVIDQRSVKSRGATISSRPAAPVPVVEGMESKEEGSESPVGSF